MRTVAPGAGCQVAVAAWGGNSFSENKYQSPKWKCYFRNGIMVIRYCKIVLQHKDTILDWGQGEKVLNETCSPKKGEFLNTSCALAKTL